MSQQMTPAMNKPSAPLPVFLHISKNAGHTVRALLHSNYPGQPCIDCIIRNQGASNLARIPSSCDPDIATLVAEIRAGEQQLGFVATNLPFGLHRYIDRPVLYFTLVREPVERCVSYWYFAHRERESGHQAWLNFERLSLDVPLILSRSEGAIIANHQVRMISGTANHTCTEQDLDLAKARIREGVVRVGAVDRFDDFLHELALALGWQHTDYQPLHVGDKSDAKLLPPGARAAFADANELDQELYRWVTEDYLPDRLQASGAPLRV